MEFASKMNGIPPKTAKSKMTGIREYFGVNGIEFRYQDLKRIRTKLPKGNSRTIEKDLDHETLKIILQHLDVKGRALVLTLASSGMRIGEALQLRIDDINLKPHPVEISIRGEYTKTGEQRFTFISDEAAQAINEWLKVRSSYLELAEKRSNGFVQKGIAKPRSGDDTRLFPFSAQVGAEMWGNALTKSGLHSVDRVTNRRQLHPHMLRKFFRSQLALACPVDIVEALMGHSGYLTDAYRRFTKKQMAEFYLKGEHLLTISVPKELKEIESEFKLKMQNHSDILERIVAENLTLRDEVNTLKGTVHKQKDDINQIVSFWGVLATSTARLIGDPELIEEVKNMLNNWKSNQ